MSIIIAGFPGVGKSHFFRQWGTTLKLSDSDSSKFPKDAFPGNYIAHIKESILANDITFVSTHSAVIAALQAEGLEFEIVAPSEDLRDEYRQRYLTRDHDPAHGDRQVFADLITSRWQGFLDSLPESAYRLGPGEYLEDHLRRTRPHLFP